MGKEAHFCGQPRLRALEVSKIWYGISLVYFQTTEHSLALPDSGWHLLLGFHPFSHLGRITFPVMLRKPRVKTEEMIRVRRL